jgi:hypothetical protein
MQPFSSNQYPVHPVPLDMLPAFWLLVHIDLAALQLILW